MAFKKCKQLLLFTITIIILLQNSLGNYRSISDAFDILIFRQITKFLWLFLHYFRIQAPHAGPYALRVEIKMNGAKFKKVFFCQAWKEHKIIINKLCIHKLLLLLALGLTSDHNNFYLFLISEKKTSNFPKSSYFSELCYCMFF